MDVSPQLMWTDNLMPFVNPSKDSLNASSNAYFDWDYDVNKSIRRRAVVAYCFAGFMAVIGVISLLTLNALTPLKEIQPLLVTVDSSTGIAEVQHHLTGVEIGQQEALDKYFIGRYVTAVEGYHYYSHKADRNNALAFSDSHARQRYLKAQSSGNPQAFVNVYKSHHSRDVHIKEVVLIDPQSRLAQVRFYVMDSRFSQPHHYTATLRYTYVEESSIPFTFLLKNPLGFVVTEYKVDEVAQ